MPGDDFRLEGVQRFVLVNIHIIHARNKHDGVNFELFLDSTNVI